MPRKASPSAAGKTAITKPSKGVSKQLTELLKTLVNSSPGTVGHASNVVAFRKCMDGSFELVYYNGPVVVEKYSFKDKDVFLEFLSKNNISLSD